MEKQEKGYSVGDRVVFRPKRKSQKAGKQADVLFSTGKDGGVFYGLRFEDGRFLQAEQDEISA
jgi:hypothetical protein